jgi:hypothetical protein
MTEKSKAQKVCDVLMECIHHIHRGDVPKDREEMYEWVRKQLHLCKIEGRPMGLSHFVLDETEDSLAHEVRFLNAVIIGMEGRVAILGGIIKAQTEALVQFTENPHVVSELKRRG